VGGGWENALEKGFKDRVGTIHKNEITNLRFNEKYLIILYKLPFI
jgi:hypothetical protein